MLDKVNEECGVFGIYDNDSLDVSRIAYLALYALQHRGQESCGIAVCNDEAVICHKDTGLIHEVFSDVMLRCLGKGKMAVGHVRHSSTNRPSRSNAQPLVSKYIKGTLTLCHNGNLINSRELRRELEQNGAIFQSTNDSEVISYIIARERIKTPTIEDAIVSAMKYLKGACSLVVMSPKKLIAVRDPFGFRPLCLGKLHNSYIIASESCALDSLGAAFIRDIRPGEVLVIDENGINSIQAEPEKSNICIFEYIYFARPDSIIENQSVHKARIRSGELLAEEHPVDADIVCGVPDSGLDAALGYSFRSGIPYGIGLIKNRYIGRTFIQPTQGQREDEVKIKLNALAATVKDKRVVLVDDSIVRGTTIGRIVKLLRDAGAKEVHLRISSPPFINPCFFGTEIDSKDRLIACRYTIEQICRHTNADSLGYLNKDHLDKIIPDADCGFCSGCFTGKYPMETPKYIEKEQFDVNVY